LPPGTFTTSVHSDEWKIANALSAGPASITEHAAVIDWPANPKDGMSHGRYFGRAPMVGHACPTSSTPSSRCSTAEWLPHKKPQYMKRRSEFPTPQGREFGA
jgi:hypothetical protein